MIGVQVYSEERREEVEDKVSDVYGKQFARERVGCREFAWKESMLYQ
jgi:hypothetical protein